MQGGATMSPERMAAIENVIAVQEAQGLAWTNLSVYKAVGGKYATLSQYLKARRASQRADATTPASATAILDQMEREVPASLLEELQAATDAEQAAEARLSVLEAKSVQEMLSEAEEIEAIRLERRVRNLASIITELESRVLAQREAIDIEQFCQQWGALVDEKRGLYTALYQSQLALWAALHALLAQHETQLDAIMSLPPRLQRYMLDSFLPDSGTIRSRIAGNMLPPQGWTMVLCEPGPPRIATVEALMANDPGTKPLPPRLIQNALNAGRPVDRSA
jgi:hypothetical protein